MDVADGAGSQGSRAGWQPRVVLLLAAAIVAVLLAVFGFVLASSEGQSRHEAEQRFLAQATIAAGLTKAIFQTSDAPQANAASASYGGAHIGAAALTALVKRSRLAYAYITDAHGRTLAGSVGTPAAAADRPAVVARALAAGSWFSDLVRSPGGGYLVAQAIPFPTRFGRRVEVLAYPAPLLSAFLGSYLRGALPDKTANGFVLDGRGLMVASSVSGVAVGKRPSPQFLAILDSAPARSSVQGQYDVASGRFRGARYVVAAAIGGSDWRVGLTESTSVLYPADVGSQWWVIWLVFLAFALTAAGCLVLLRRSLGAAGQLVEQARRVDLANAELHTVNGELNAFSYSVSHDLRAPLRAIDGFSRIVVEDDTGALSDSQRRYLGLVRENTETMGRLIDELLAFSRLASQPVTRTSVDTATLVEALEGELRGTERERAIDFVNGVLPIVDADHTLLRQVFADLLGNALKYTRKQDHARITVDSERDQGELVFRVADNGVGFDRRYADKLFQVFQRLHRAEDYEGNGVGLAIVQRIVSRHRGRVWAEGRPGEGAAFYFTLKPAAR